MPWKRIGKCIYCNGKIYMNTETGEIDRSDCICNKPGVGICGYPELFSECHNAVGSNCCLGIKEKQHPECPAVLDLDEKD